MLALVLWAVACHDPGKADDSEGTPPGDSRESGVEDSCRDSEAETGGDDTASLCDTGLPCFADRDGDGHGDPIQPTCCDDPRGASADSLDCDDNHALVFSGAAELATSGRDDDCDGFGGGGSIEDLPLWIAVEGGEVSGCCLLGYDIALPGDLDGDGVADLMVDSHVYLEEDGDLAAAAQVFQGPLAGGQEAIDLRDAYASLRLVGSGALMESVAGAGDVDGDGFQDVLVAGRYNSTNPLGHTAVFLQRGPIPPGVTYLQDTAQAWYAPGNSLLIYAHGPGDLDGDGFDDIVLSDPQAADTDGEVYLLRGPVTQTSLADADAIIQGEWSAGIESMIPLGDLDGDGDPDLGVTANEYRHLTQLFLDPPSGTVPVSDGDVALWQDLEEVARHDYMMVREVGDLDGDGYTDLAFAGSYSDALLVLLGPFGGEPVVDLAISWDAAFVTANGGFSSYIFLDATPLGDWDGDGHADLAIANKSFVPEEVREDWWDEWDYPAGVVFLVTGPVAGGVYDLEVSADRVSPGRYTTFPTSMAGGSDLDGDGFPDLAIGDDEADAAYVLFGGGLY